MIVELAIGAAVVGAGAALARYVVRRRAVARAVTPTPAPKSRGAGLQPGDVLLHGRAEHALDRASELEDGTLLRVLEVIATSPRFVVQLDTQGERLVLAEPYDALPEGRVADAVALGTRSLRLERRGRAAARPVVEGHDGLFSGPCSFTVLADRAGRHLVVIEPEGAPRLCLLGDLLDRRLVDLLPAS